MSGLNLGFALTYARRGWHVFPVRPAAGEPGSPEYKESKRPLTSHGKDDATTDEDTIRVWWDKWPDARVGVYGRPSGLLLIDQDTYKGEATLPVVPGYAWPLTATISTPSGGWHYLYELPEGEWTDRRETATSAVCTKVNGYTILPTPGSGYEWAVQYEPQPLPPPLVEALLTPITRTEVSEADLVGREQALAQIIRFMDLGEYRLKGEDSLGRVIATLERCPFDAEDHSAPWKAVVGIASNGKPFASCVVDGCAGRGWADLVPEHVQADAFTDGAQAAIQEIPVALHVWTGQELAEADFPPMSLLPVLGRPFIYTGLSTVIGSPAKFGKTTLMLHAVQEWLLAGHRVLYVTEESAYLWHETKLPKYPGLVTEAFSLLPSYGAHRELVLDRLATGPEDIVIVDTLRGVLQFSDENDNAEVQATLIPWITAARDGQKTLVAVHHSRKTRGGTPSQNLAGAHALAGAFDQIVSLEETEAPPLRKADQVGRVGSEELHYDYRNGGLVSVDAHAVLARIAGSRP